MLAMIAHGGLVKGKALVIEHIIGVPSIRMANDRAIFLG
jgi:hypothetical protein